VLGKLGKYRLEAELGRGGMAVVYEATKTGASGFLKRVCVKQIREELGDDAQFVEMFEQEARVAATLMHANIVEIFDFDLHEGRLLLEMELVDGIDLRRLLRWARGQGVAVPLGFARHVTAGLLAGLCHAHERTVDGELEPVIHRDVSPANILISTKGEVKLTDFGIAKARGGSVATEVGTIKGKYAYLSPEQARGERVGTGSDLYSAGLVLYELLSGRRFNRGEDQGQELGRAANPRDPRLSWLSDDWNELLSRLLAADPADRFASARDAAAALDQISLDASYTTADAGHLVQSVRELLTAASSHEPTELRTPAGEPVADEIDALESEPTTSSSSEVPRPAAVAPGGARSVEGEPRKERYAWVKAALAFAAALGLFVLASHLMREAEDGGEPGAPSVAAADPDDGGVESAPIAESADDRVDARAGEAAGDGGIDADERADAATARAPITAFGRLDVNCRPWAQVLVDGRAVGTTPIKGLRTRAGKRRVTLVNEELGYRRTFTVEVPRGGAGSLSREIAAPMPGESE
jgi:serine/threonine protein kinase